MKSLAIFGILMVVVFVLGTISMAEAHPHANIDLMESHSHNIHDNNFQVPSLRKRNAVAPPIGTVAASSKVKLDGIIDTTPSSGRLLYSA